MSVIDPVTISREHTESVAVDCRIAGLRAPEGKVELVVGQDLPFITASLGILFLPHSSLPGSLAWVLPTILSVFMCGLPHAQNLPGTITVNPDQMLLLLRTQSLLISLRLKKYI